MIKVKITDSESEYIEKLYYEYQATLNILTYLLEQTTIAQPEIITQITERCEQRHMELEIAKSATVAAYKPADLTGQFTYNFNFFEHEIEFIEK